MHAGLACAVQLYESANTFGNLIDQIGGHPSIRARLSQLANQEIKRPPHKIVFHYISIPKLGTHSNFFSAYCGLDSVLILQSKHCFRLYFYLTSQTC